MASRFSVERTDTGDTKETTHPSFNIFRGPPRHAERVCSALTSYLEKVRDMKVAKADLLSKLMNMCPKHWKILPELRVYLEDQSMVWSLLVSDLRPVFGRLRKYALLSQSAKYTLEEFEARLSEVHTMTAEYELMKQSPHVSRTQKMQIEYMLRESNRALAAIRGSVEEKLLSFRKSQTEIGKDLLHKFEEVQRATCDEHMQVIKMIEDRLDAAPVKRLNHYGQPEEDLEFVQNLVQGIVDSIWSTPVDLSARMKMYNEPKTKTRPTETVNQGSGNPKGVQGRPASVDQGLNSEYKQGQGQYSGYKQGEGRGQTQKHSGSTARPYSSSMMPKQEQRPSRVSRPKTSAVSAAEKESFDSTTSLYSWDSGAGQTKPRNVGFGLSYNNSSRVQLDGAIPFSNSKSNIIRHVQAPSTTNTSSSLRVYPQNTTYPAARQNQGHSQSQVQDQSQGQIHTSWSSRPPSRSSMQGPSNVSNTQHQSQTQGQERASRSSRPSSRASKQDPSNVSNAQPQSQSQGQERTSRTSRPSSRAAQQDQSNASITQHQTQSQGQERTSRSSRPSSRASQQDQSNVSTTQQQTQSQGQERTSRSSRPSSRASQQDSSNVSNTQHQGPGRIGKSTSRGFKIVECDESMEDLYNFCKPSKLKDTTSHTSRSRLPSKSVPFPASCYEDTDPDFYDCE